MKILVGPDSFKGSLSAYEFCKIAEKTILEKYKDDEVILLPLADGGEGTIDALTSGGRGVKITLQVKNPLYENIHASYGLSKDGKTAIIEMAEASGLPLISKEQRNPMKATTFGTGQLIIDAVKRGCKKIIIGIGGSATNDAGIGMMQAMGFKCLDEFGEQVPFGGEGLLKLKKIVKPDNSPYTDLIKSIDIQVACDVDNKIYGKNGAAYVYAAQKGADKDMIKELDKGLVNFANVCKDSLGIDVSEIEGGGAAGGLGAGLCAALGAKLVSGFEIISQYVELEKYFQEGVDLVISGEGVINSQSFNGKLPIEIAKLANKYSVPTILIVGARQVNIYDIERFGIKGVFPINSGPMSLEYSMKHAKELLADTLKNVLSLLH